MLHDGEGGLEDGNTGVPAVIEGAGTLWHSKCLKQFEQYIYHYPCIYVYCAIGEEWVITIISPAFKIVIISYHCA